MNAVALAVALTLAAPVAQAMEPAPKAPLQLRPKAGVVVLSVVHQFAPFVEPLADPDHLGLLPQRDHRLSSSRSSCSGESALCYDPSSGRIVYKPARMLMPDIPGLRRENISVKRDRIVFRYSFE